MFLPVVVCGSLFYALHFCLLLLLSVAVFMRLFLYPILSLEDLHVVVFVCGCFYLPRFLGVDVSVCRCFCVSRFLAVDVFACRGFCLSRFLYVAVFVCRCFRMLGISVLNPKCFEVKPQMF